MGVSVEPIALGLLLAPSKAGLFLSVGALGLFLARHPFKLAMADRRRNRRSSRTAYAERFAALYLIIAIFGFALTVKTGGPAFLCPLLFAAPFGLVQLFYDATGRSRALIAELAGSISTGALSTAIVLIGGWPRATAFGLWVILASRNVPTILYVRAKLRLLHGKPAAVLPPILAHLLAMAIVFGCALAGAASWLALIALMILLLRAVIGLSTSGGRITAKKLGLSELGFGAMTVLAVFLGHVLG